MVNKGAAPGHVANTAPAIVLGDKVESRSHPRSDVRLRVPSNAKKGASPGEPGGHVHRRPVSITARRQRTAPESPIAHRTGVSHHKKKKTEDEKEHGCHVRAGRRFHPQRRLSRWSHLRDEQAEARARPPVLKDAA